MQKEEVHYICMLQIYVHLICCFIAVEAFKGEIRQLENNKKFISRLSDRRFEVVHPFQIREKNDRIGIDTRNYYLNGNLHYKQVTIVIRTVSNGRLKLLLVLNEFLFGNKTVLRKTDGEGKSSFTDNLVNCYYHGRISGEDSSFVALSTCNGLRGILAFSNGTTLGIWPLDGGDKGKRHPHVLYHTTWPKTANSGTRVGKRHVKKFHRNKRRGTTRQTKFIELAVIGNHSFVNEHDSSDVSAMRFILEAVNIADIVFWQSLNIRLSVVFGELWSDSRSGVKANLDIERTLGDLVELVTGSLYHIEKDATVVFTSDKFANSEVSSSNFGSICSSRAVGIITTVDMYTSHGTGQVLAHNLAQLLGLSYDTPECSCGLEHCLMRKQIGSGGLPFSWRFSKCTLAHMHSILQSAHSHCLLNRPFEVMPLRQCGNKIVDIGEECDCGQREECLDPCCDSLTCSFHSHAQCASHQTCCIRCRFKPAGDICRASRSVCDVPEVCSGVSGDCPSDGYFVDGTVCGINGHCWKGNCTDVEQQCRDLWGLDSVVSDEPCFERNMLGVEYANCGVKTDGSFRKCMPDDIKCGTLHCSDGQTSPLNISLNSFNLQFLHDGHQVHCKVVTNSEAGAVPDGSKCKSGKVCVQGICLPLMQVSTPMQCPTNNLAFQCSGHGDCMTTQSCQCYDGWTGSACDSRTNFSLSILPTSLSPFHDIFTPINVGRTLNTTTLLAILLLVGVVLLVFLVCLLFCYRRRSGIEFSCPADEKLNESIPENNDRSIKFGNMPSYREEKRKRKSDKRIYDALHRLNGTECEKRDLLHRSHEIIGNNEFENGSLTSCNHFSNGTCIQNSRAILCSAIGSPAPILKDPSVRHRRLIGGGDLCCQSPCSEMAGSKCSLMEVSERCRNGYATDTELAMSRYGRYPSLKSQKMDRSPSSQARVYRMAPTALKLNNIGILLRQLQYSDDVNSESDSHNIEMNHMDRVGSSMSMELGRQTFEAINGFDFSTSNGEQHEQMWAEKHLDCSANCYDSIIANNCQPAKHHPPERLNRDEMVVDHHDLLSGDSSVLNERQNDRQSLFTDSFRLDL